MGSDYLLDMNNIAVVKEVPIWEKFNLTVDEASAYFNIGKNRLRDLLEEPGCPFALNVGNKKKLIKRKKLEQYIEKAEWI